jgi:S1-C subfamily serine protease
MNGRTRSQRSTIELSAQGLAGLLQRAPKPGVGSISATMRWLAAACLALAVFQPTRAMGQQLPSEAALGQSAGDEPVTPSQLQTINDYLGIDGGQIEISQLGIMVRDGSARLDDGEKISGASVVEVSATAPAAKALDSHRASRLILDGALVGTAVASAVFFPPALIGVALLANSNIGESHDLVIAVDGYRVRNILDLVEPVEGTQSGDTVYLVIVRNGHRLQVPIQVR